MPTSSPGKVYLLVHDTENEQRVSHKISLGQATRLLNEAIDPLDFSLTHPARRTSHHLRLKIEECAHSHTETDPGELMKILLQPQLLARIAHRNEQDVCPRRVHGRHAQFRSPVKAVARPGDS